VDPGCRQLATQRPTAIPMVYEFEDDMKPARRYYLGDQETVKKAAEAVADQVRRKD